MLSKLIEALTIFNKYGDPGCPTHCEHDELFIMIDPDDVSREDKDKLEDLWFTETGDGTFRSGYFGSA